MKNGFACLLTLALFLQPFSCPAQSGPLLVDQNGDGLVVFMAFGDSITYGLGDGIAPGAQVDALPIPPRPIGYPDRIEGLAGVQVDNLSVPGEGFIASGIDRLPGALRSSAADLVILMEGANDAWQRVDPGSYERNLQKALNIIIASGKAALLLTLPPPCENHSGSRMFTDPYTSKIRELAVLNEVQLSDLEKTWRTTCDNLEHCQLYNLPDGLHPNSLGYDAIAQTVLATLYGIDIFSAQGAAELESALGLEAGSVVVKPDPAAQS